MRETVLGVTRCVLLSALVIWGGAPVCAQQTDDTAAAPAAADSPAPIGQQDVVSAVAPVDQDTPRSPTDHQPPVGDSDSGVPAMFPHFKNDRIWISGQANFISQWHPGFHSPYSGKNSLSAEAQDATSRVLTLFTGLRLTSTSEFLCDIQETGGHGIGEALGLAGFTNLDVVRNPTLSKAPYVARLMWHQVIPLGHKNIARRSATPFSLFTELPERRHGNSLRKIQPGGFF